jgi:PAS domain S-box-containing protein
VDETARLNRLQAYRALDTEAEARFDRLAALAADLFDAPIALISLIDAERQWFKARHGLDAAETPREQAFCAHVLPLGPGATLVVENAVEDARFRDNPLVTGAPHIRFYAGAALAAPDGHVLGTLCVIDDQPRPRPSDRQLNRLRALADVVVGEFEFGVSVRAEQERRRLLELAEAMSGVGRWRLDLATKRVEWSDEVYRIHGVSRETFDPNLNSALDFYPPEDRAEVEASLARTMEGAAPIGFRLRIRRADGELRDVVSRSCCERDNAGRPLALFGVFQDVTDQARALKAVQDSEQRYRLLADRVTDMINRSNLDCDILYASPASLALTGYAPEELVGRKTREFVHPEDWPRVYREYAKLVQFGLEARVLAIRYRFKRKDGVYRWVEVAPTLVWDGDRPVEFVDVVRDVEARVAVEHELEAARAAAEAASEAKAEFLANMSHELRTPLTSIIGFTQIAAQQADLPPAAHRCVTKVKEASRALLATVNDILDFSKLEAGQVHVEPRPVDLEDLCRSTLDLLAPQADAKDLALELDFEGPNAALVDPDRVRQILLNYLGNAVKFTARGGVRLNVRHDADSGRMRAEVIDTGPGLTAEQAERLFLRFSQVDGGLARAHGGTGLGLAICKGLAELMGGRVGVDSRPGEGSRFWFEIDAPAAEISVEDGRETRVDLAGARVLIVDDSAANREIARLILQSAGAQTTEADDGLSGASAADAAPFDAVLMDLRMPGMNGRDALLAIRRPGALNEATPVAAFSADAATSRDALFRAGFDDVVGKPLDPETLLAVVARMIAGEPLAGEIRRVA